MRLDSDLPGLNALSPSYVLFGFAAQVGVEDITDIIEKFEDEVQSVDMTTMNRL